MKKIILSFVLILIVAIAGGVYYVLSNLDNLIKEAIETYGSEATQTAVRVESVKLKLTEGSGGITGLTIDNPEGYALPLAFSLGTIRLGIDLQSLQQEPYIINEITVIAPEVFVAINKDNKTNLNELKNNLMASLPAATDDQAKKESTKKGDAEPRLIIRKVKFADGLIKAKVAALDNKEYKLKLPAIELNDLGGKNGLTPTELASEILSRLTDSASKAVKEKIIDAKLDELKAEAKAKLEAKKAEAREKIEAEKAQAKEKLEATKAEADAKLAEEKAKLDAQKDEKTDALRQKTKDKLKGLFDR